MIRPATLEDFDAVTPLFEQLWPGKPIDCEALYAVLARAAASETDALLCLEAEGHIAGFCAYAIVNNLWQEGHIAYVYALVVNEACRGKGVRQAAHGRGDIAVSRKGLKTRGTGFRVPPRGRARVLREVGVSGVSVFVSSVTHIFYRLTFR